MGVKVMVKKRYVTLEWPLFCRVVDSDFRRKWYGLGIPSGPNTERQWDQTEFQWRSGRAWGKKGLI